jgi:hypothetical protein
LILILACLMASSALIGLDQPSGDGRHDVQDLEGRFDCVLSSMLDLRYVIGGVDVERQLSVERYVIEMSCCGRENNVPPDDNATEEISALVDFYFSGFGGWNLRVNCSSCGSIEVASRGQATTDGGNTYILSRPLIGTDCGKSCLELVIFK